MNAETKFSENTWIKEEGSNYNCRCHTTGNFAWFVVYGSPNVGRTAKCEWLRRDTRTGILKNINLQLQDQKRDRSIRWRIREMWWRDLETAGWRSRSVAVSVVAT